MQVIVRIVVQYKDNNDIEHYEHQLGLIGSINKAIQHGLLTDHATDAEVIDFLVD